jgi:hypothetical protein
MWSITAGGELDGPASRIKLENVFFFLIIMHTWCPAEAHVPSEAQSGCLPELCTWLIFLTLARLQ